MSLVNMLLHAHAFLLGQKAGMIIRIIATAAIYRKVQYILVCCGTASNSSIQLPLSITQILRLSQVTLNDVSIGRVVNLASNDVQRFDLVMVVSVNYFLFPL